MYQDFEHPLGDGGREAAHDAEVEEADAAVLQHNNNNNNDNNNKRKEIIT